MRYLRRAIRLGLLGALYVAMCFVMHIAVRAGAVIGANTSVMYILQGAGVSIEEIEAVRNIDLNIRLSDGVQFVEAWFGESHFVPGTCLALVIYGVPALIVYLAARATRRDRI